MEDSELETRLSYRVHIPSLAILHLVIVAAIIRIITRIL